MRRVLDCKIAEMPFPFLQGPSISPATFLEPRFSERQSPQLLFRICHRGGSLKLPAPGLKKLQCLRISPQSRRDTCFPLPGCQ